MLGEEQKMINKASVIVEMHLRKMVSEVTETCVQGVC
jgi:hypothetical protein